MQRGQMGEKSEGFEPHRGPGLKMVHDPAGFEVTLNTAERPASVGNKRPGTSTSRELSGDHKAELHLPHPPESSPCYRPHTNLPSCRAYSGT
jgi:hypothetical protein